MDIDLSGFKKGEANVTGFQLVNYVDPGVSRIVQQWMDFDNKDSKVTKKGLKVSILCAYAMSYKFLFPLTRIENLPDEKSESFVKINYVNYNNSPREERGYLRIPLSNAIFFSATLVKLFI